MQHLLLSLVLGALTWHADALVVHARAPAFRSATAPRVPPALAQFGFGGGEPERTKLSRDTEPDEFFQTNMGEPPRARSRGQRPPRASSTHVVSPQMT